MVSLLLSRGLRTKEDNEKNRKREKRNEIQCMIYVKSCLFVFILLKLCSQKENRYVKINNNEIYRFICWIRKVS